MPSLSSFFTVVLLSFSGFVAGAVGSVALGLFSLRLLRNRVLLAELSTGAMMLIGVAGFADLWTRPGLNAAQGRCVPGSRWAAGSVPTQGPIGEVGCAERAL
jgi:hypothetical protein